MTAVNQRRVDRQAGADTGWHKILKLVLLDITQKMHLKNGNGEGHRESSLGVRFGIKTYVQEDGY